MHRCLLVPEIVTIVCDRLSDPPLSSDLSSDLASLAAFARTCHAVHEKALDRLWLTQNTIIPLLRCMPADVWEKRPYYSDDWSLGDDEEDIKFVVVGYSTNNTLY